MNITSSKCGIISIEKLFLVCVFYQYKQNVIIYDPVMSTT